MELQPPTLAQQARALGGGVADLAQQVASRDPSLTLPEAFWRLSGAVERLAYLTANTADMAQFALLAANRREKRPEDDQGDPSKGYDEGDEGQGEAVKDRIVGINEAAARLGLKVRTLSLMCREGRSPVRCVKRDDGPKAEWVFSDWEITRYIDSRFPAQAEAG